MSTKVKTVWAYTPTGIVVLCDSQQEARTKVKQEYRVWAEAAARMNVPRTWIKYPFCKHNGFEIPASMVVESHKEPINTIRKEIAMFDEEKIFPCLEIAASLPSSPGIIKALGTIAEKPDERWVLLRLGKDLSSQVQVAMTESMQACITGATVKQALQRDRSEYFHLEDLEDLKKRIRQESDFETEWRGYSPVTKANWRSFRYHYQTIEVANGFIWQLGHNLDLPTPITTPV